MMVALALPSVESATRIAVRLPAHVPSARSTASTATTAPYLTAAAVRPHDQEVGIKSKIPILVGFDSVSGIEWKYSTKIEWNYLDKV
jgi:hypothetical protein